MRLLWPYFIQPKTRHNFSFSWHAYPYPEAQSHASFLHEASYFGLTRQPNFVSLWQLDLERAESRPPLNVERTR